MLPRSCRVRRAGLSTLRVIGASGVTVAALCLPGVAGSANAATPAPAAAPASYVDPMIGTGAGDAVVGSVDEYPGPDAPFGMIQWGPVTGPAGSVVGYNYGDTTIDGFSLTRLGGVGCSIFGDFKFLPTDQAVSASPGTAAGWDSYVSGFSHGDETAQAGYYSVTTANGIKTELTTATRAALGRFTYPAGSQATMLINASSSYGGDGDTLQIASDDEITGSATGGEFCGHTTQRYTVYFSVTFDHPFSSYGTWEGSTATSGSSSATGTAAGGWVNFAASSPGPTVIGAKVAISYVSVAGAQSNQATTGTDFDAVRARTYQEWNRLLGKIDVSGGTGAEETTFYTALYHAMLDPNIVSDADGQYMGFDFKVHTVPEGHAEYSDFSSWDIYRCEVPLLALLVPGQASDMMQSLVDAAEQGGWLPNWPTADVYTGMMGGDASDPIIADAYAFGARDFDVKAALRYMLKGADDITSQAGQGDFVPRSDYTVGDTYDDYLDDGYIPTGPDTATFGSSLTEEDAVADFSIGRFAAGIGDASTAATFARRSQNWQNILDPATGEVMPRGPQAPLGGDPATQTDGFEEGDAAQYTWMVPQNLSGLFTALGGDSGVNSELDGFFTELNAGSDLPYDWAGNEVTLGAPWEYDYSGEPWKTQAVVREIATQLYGPTPGGEPGNDDLGAMSSWYVWAALGMYPETPGTSTLALGSPLFPDTVIHEGDGHTITIDAPQAAAGAPYVQSLTVNGRTWDGNYLTASQYVGGATLGYALGTTPDTGRGTAPQDAPPSYTRGESGAIGFTSPWDGVTAERGAPVTVQVGAQSETQHTQTVAWLAAAPSGITLTPSSGTLTLGPGGRATAPLTVSGISGSLPVGQYPVSITFTGPGGAKASAADLYVTVPPQITLTAGQANLDVAAGGSDQATYTITNNVQDAARTVTLASSPDPAGVTSTLSATSVTIPAGGSEQVTTTFANPAITAGTGDYTITADDTADGYTVTGATRLTYTSDLALNAYRTPYPAPSATSTASGSSPFLAVDGSTSTSWVSGAAPTASAPVDFEDDLGAPADIASVSVSTQANAGPADYTIQASADGQGWTTVGTVSSAAASSATTTQVTPTTARYLRLVITGSHASGSVAIAELDVSAQPGPITTLANEQNLNLAAGGQNQASYTITNNQPTTADVTLSGSGPSGVTVALSATSAAIPAGGSATVTATFGDASTTTGVEIYTLTATDGAGNAGTGATELYFGSDLALNAFGTPYPAASAISSQAAYPPSLAIDGNTSTFWVSGGPAPSASTPLWLEVNFGSPVSLASVSVTPRPGYGSPDYTLQASADGQNWTTIATVTDAASSGTSTTAVTATGVRYLRLVMTGTYQGTGQTDQIAELSATSP